MKQFYLFILLLASVTAKAQLPVPYMLLDNFNRNDSVKVGVPAGSVYEYWLEYGEVNFGCVGTSCIRLKNNAMEMSRYDWNGTGCLANSAKAANIEMTYKYSTVLSASPGPLQWYFNMQQSLADPTGFSPGEDGIAFVVACSVSNPANSPKGYAVVYGDATTDRIRLVSFQASFTDGSFTDIVSVAPPANKADYMSIRVTYDPCTGEWSLKMRDDGTAAFADPSTISGAPAAGETAIDNTLTSFNLPWIGGIWNHGSSNSVARFDNVYIPNGNTVGSYVWNGNGTDFQNPLNWTPARYCINAGDRLLFNALTPATAVVTNIPSQTIRQLWITDNRDVTFKDVADGAINTINVTGAAGADYRIDAGSSLTLDVATASAQDAIVINLATGTTGSVAGNLVFTNSATGSTNPHRLLAADANAVTVTGMISASHLAGNPFGNTGTANTVLFNAGSVYEYHDGGDPFGLSIPASKVVFNRGSTYRHISDNLPQWCGRTYANFECSGNINIINGLDGSVCSIDTLIVETDSLQLTGSANGQELSTNIKGNLAVSAGATFNYSPAATGTLMFSSNFASQKLISTGTFIAGHNLTVRLNSSFANPQLSVENNISIAGMLQVSLGTLLLNANITMLSDSLHTASVSKITGGIAYGAGRFVIERFIRAHKAWQFIASPVTGQTIKESWQENNSPCGNTNPGYGTIITSNIAGNGFDLLTPTGPSMKTYKYATDSWIGVPNTDATAVSNQKGYMLMIRGDRSVTSYNASPVPAILRSTGKIYAPGSLPPFTSVLSGKYESVGNPFASAIDFNLVTRTGGVQNVFYTWDPLLSGGYGLGGIQTFTFNGTGYDIMPGGGSYASGNHYIESGQAFFVHCTSPNGTVVFTENAKVNTSNLVTKPGRHANMLRVNLYVMVNGRPVLLDGVLSRFDRSFSCNIDDADAFKMETAGESIAILQNGISLAAEKRGLLQASDTIRYKLQHLRQQEYQLRIINSQVNLTGRDMYLVDQWLGTKTRIENPDTAVISFSVTADSASGAGNRFYLLFNEPAQEIYQPAVAADIMIHPNPAVNRTVTVTLNGQPQGKYHVELVNETGQQLYSSSFLVQEAISTHTFHPAKNIASGKYLLIISAPGKLITKPVIMQ